MTDLVRILPSFPTGPFAALLATIEQHALTTTDLLALHPADIAKQTHLSLLDLKRLIAAVQACLSDDLVPEKLVVEETRPSPPNDAAEAEPATSAAAAAAASPAAAPSPPLRPAAALRDDVTVISTLDDDLDAALAGGVPVGCITEFAGESGAGKTQLLLSLCLAVQLPPPRGPGKQAVYISTESGLATQRLKQLMAASPALARADGSPSLDDIFITLTPDLESQEHILEYQVPVLLTRHRIGLLVIDSVAANYRAEFERRGSHGSNMAARTAELVRLGSLLRDMARKHGIAVVVANQVADRFSLPPAIPYVPSRGLPAGTQDTPLASRSAAPPSSLASTPSSSLPFQSHSQDGLAAPPALRLDHQQRWFTGWGDDPHASDPLKTPSLGLVWSTQIACRVALLKRPVYGRPRRIAAPLDADDDEDAAAPTLKSWRRWMKVVFAPHVGASGQGVDGCTEFELTTGGLKAVKTKLGQS